MFDLNKRLRDEQKKEDDLEKQIREWKIKSRKRPISEELNQPRIKRHRKNDSHHYIEDLAEDQLPKCNTNRDDYDEGVEQAIDAAITACETSYDAGEDTGTTVAKGDTPTDATKTGQDSSYDAGDGPDVDSSHDTGKHTDTMVDEGGSTTIDADRLDGDSSCGAGADTDIMGTEGDTTPDAERRILEEIKIVNTFRNMAKKMKPQSKLRVKRLQEGQNMSRKVTNQRALAGKTLKRFIDRMIDEIPEMRVKEEVRNKQKQRQHRDTPAIPCLEEECMNMLSGMTLYQGAQRLERMNEQNQQEW